MIPYSWTCTSLLPGLSEGTCEARNQLCEGVYGIKSDGDFIT